jgi:hypothetical protein
MSASEPPQRIVISALEANAWWRKHELLGAVLNGLCFAILAAPIVLVVNDLFKASVAAFALVVPYFLLVRFLAVLAVKRRLANHPESLSEFKDAGVLREVGIEDVD